MKEITISFGNEIELTRSKSTQKQIWVKLACSFREKQLRQLKGASLSVFICLGLHANGQGYCWPSNETIIKETGYDINTVLRAKHKLEKQKYIYRQQLRKKGERYTVCLYRIFRPPGKDYRHPFNQNDVTADTLKQSNGFENEQTLEPSIDEGRSPQAEVKNEEEVEPLFKKNIYSIFSYWNSKGKKNVTVHRYIKDFAPTIKTALEDYSEKEIKESIDNYVAIKESPEHYWSHKYGLKDFLTRKGNVDRFLSENDPFSNYKISCRIEQKRPKSASERPL